MTESTTPAQCRDEDWNLARDCGLMSATPGTNAWDASLARFADGVRDALSADTARLCDEEVTGLTVGQLPTLNQDSYPSLGEWWVQLWDGRGDDAKVIARAYGDTPQHAMELAKAIHRALLNAPTQEPGTLPYPTEITEALFDVLSLMLWHTGPIAHVLRAGGAEIKKRAEDEQAHVLHWFIQLAIQHGPAWRERATASINEIRAAVTKEQA
ncbi:hypothetical protein ACUXAV_000695 [Cupriavidus metallidurans]|uniref:hypothetical protein n=1 Tax=Cupriavidus metallidurans TaxID=119219 RepID=UPI00068C9A65|nr:hypothetical protein [Cupriavidus metallidurans]MDE4918596.1 hypothetical protein [Cupriavidus metallidurans]